MLFKQVLKQLKPTEKEMKEMKKFTENLTQKIKKMTKEAEPLICGSVAKNTWLSKKKEMDLFLLFSPKLSKKELESKGLDLAKKIVKGFNGRYEVAFSEHPYLKSWMRGYEIDIVPCYAIADPEKIKSAVDRTPFHVEFVRENLKNPDEVRLLKQFCIANKCYGADVKMQAFSGYLCELLIIKYKTFMDCVKDAQNWRAGHNISFTPVDKAMMKKFKNPLIVIDPVDKNRNVGAAVSADSFYRFVKVCRDFVKNPSEKFFFPREMKSYSSKELSNLNEKRGTGWFVLQFKKPKILEDVLYSQMRKCVKAINHLLSQNGFRVLKSDFYCGDDCYLFYEMEVWQVTKVTKNIGPNVYSKHAENFLNHYKNKKVFVEDDNWVVEIEREFTDTLHFFKTLFKKSEKELLKKGMPSKIAPNIRNCRVYSNENALKVINKSPKDFKIFLRELFEKDLF